MQARLQHNRTRGFTLMELLVALGIFAIAFTALAAIFPVGIVLQRQTFDAITAEQAQRNALALASGAKLTPTAIPHMTDPPGESKVAWDTNYATALDGVWPMSDRSFPIYETDVSERDFYAMPFYRAVDRSNWTTDKTIRVTVLLLQRESGGTPTVAQATGTVDGTEKDKFNFGTALTDAIEEDTYVIDSNGIPYRVVTGGTDSIVVEGMFGWDAANGEPDAIYYGENNTAVQASAPYEYQVN